MTKKAKAAAQDWQTGAGYPEHGERTDLWAWEFLRRNPEYRTDWRRFIAVADDLRAAYSKPCTGLTGEWEGQEKSPYWLIVQAEQNEDPRAFVFEPTRKNGETASDWVRRVHANGERCIMTPLAQALGKPWGLDCIADPTLSRLGMMSRWEASPLGVCSPGPYRDNQESTWAYAFERVADILHPDPLPAVSLVEARKLLADFLSAWSKRAAEMRENERPKYGDHYVLEFDLRGSIPEQLKHAGTLLEHQQRKYREGGGEVWSAGRRNKETPGYATYLRVLDAVEEIGETNVTAWRAGIASAMISGYPSKAKHDVRKSYLDKASTWVERAKQLRDGEYKRLVAMASMPTPEKHEQARQRRK